MKEEPVILSSAQRTSVEQIIRKHCKIRGWMLHAMNVRSNHVHVVVTTNRDAQEVMNQLKAWCSRKLSDTAGLENKIAAKSGRRRWFTEGGDKKMIENEEYLENAIRYVLERQ